MSCTRNDRIVGDERLIAGIRMHIGKAVPIFLAGERYSIAELIALLQSRVDSARAISPVLAAWRMAVHADRRRVAETQHVVNALRQYVAAMYGASLDVLADFGLAPYKRRHLTAAENAERASKARATRDARRALRNGSRVRIAGPPAPVGAPAASDPPAAPAVDS